MTIREELIRVGEHDVKITRSREGPFSTGPHYEARVDRILPTHRPWILPHLRGWPLALEPTRTWVCP
jgi:hypothetical protein